MDDNKRILAALELLHRYSQIDGDHHKAWVIDQVARCLLGENYDAWVEEYEEGGEYEWSVGIAP